MINNIGIISCKGGVGKSTITVNIATYMSYYYKKQIGLLDADLHGPNHPSILNTKYKIETDKTNSFFMPLEIFNLKSMSMGYFLKDNASVLLRGPMLSNTIKHLFEKTQWGDITCLFIDFPPGTGDVYLSLLRDIQFKGVFLITTPNLLAIEDLKRSVSMLQKFNINIYGIIENMAYYECKSCKNIEYIYGKNEQILKFIVEFNINKHYILPIDTQISSSNNVKPFVLLNQNSASSKTIKQIVDDLNTNM